MKALKIIGIIFLVFVVAIGVLIYVGIRSMDTGIKNMLEQVGTEITGTKVTVADINTKLTAVRGEIHGVVIANPEGFNSDYAFSLNQIAVQLNPERMNGQLFVIHEILIDGASLVYEEKNLTGSNLKTIGDHVQAQMDKNGGQMQRNNQQQGPPIRFILENFTFSNAEVKLLSDQYGEKTLSIPTITETNIGGDSGISGEELGAYLMDNVINRTKNLVEDELKGRAKEEVRSRAKEALDENLSDEDKSRLDRARNLLGR